MLIAALALNILILVPVLVSLVASGPGVDMAFGPDTAARRILACLYGAIALVSAGLIALHLMDHHAAVAMTVALFAVQMTYKLGTVVAVGLVSPVVLTNLLVVAVQIAVLAALWLRA